MAAPSREDLTDLDSLFGDADSQDGFENEPQVTNKRSMIQFPRAAVLSQNVGTIAPSSVPSSTEHPHSSGHLSSPSILPAMSTVSEAPLPRGKRGVSPGPSPQKRRRVDAEVHVAANNPKSILATLGVAVGTDNGLTQAKLKSVADLLAPSTNSARNTPRGPKGKKPTPTAPPPAALGAGTATDPVIISDEPPNQSASSTTTRRTTRSQEAHMLFDALPDDPSDVLTQTLRTILKNPTAVPRGRSSVSRDTAVYLANGRLTGTPFLRLLRHLAGPNRRTNPALGLTLLKKLVEAMRATEDAASKSAPAGPSSAASTPMPATPDTPSTTLFAAQDSSSLHCAAEKQFEPSLFPDMDFSAMGLGALSLPTIAEIDPTTPTDIAIDPELLALSNNPGYTQNSNVFENFDLAELFGVLTSSEPEGIAPINPSVPALEPFHVDPSIPWDPLTDLSLDNLFATCVPQEQCLSTASPPQIATQASLPPFPAGQQSAQPTIFFSSQRPSQQVSSSGTIRIPPRAEALALLERAQARKKELEDKLAAARRQLWGCKIEAGVERNLLEALKKGR